MKESQVIDKMIAENKVRYEKLQAHYDPITGQGGIGERVELHIPDFAIPHQHVPKEMMRNGLIAEIVKAGSIENFLKDQRFLTFDKDRVEKEIIKVREKYDFQFWAYFEIHIDDKTGRGTIPFKLNYAQVYVLGIVENMRKNLEPIRLIICKARQWGGSTFCLFYQVWLALKWEPTYKFSVCAQVNGVASSITRMFTDALYMYKPWSLDNNTKELRLVSIPNSSEYVIKDAAGERVRRNIIRIGSAENSDNLRGLPGSGAHFSEVSVWPDTPMKRAEDLVKSITGGVLPLPYTMEVFESTPKGAGNFFHRSWLEAKEGKSNFTPVFVPWFYIPHDTLTVPDYRELAQWLYDNRDNDKPEGKWRDSGKYYWRLWEMGATLEGIQWYRYKALEYTDHADMASEAPSDDIEAFTFSGTKVFNVYQLDAVRRDCIDPVRTGMLMSAAMKGAGVLRNVRFVDMKQGDLKVWKEPDRETQISDRYIVSVDVGGRNPTSDWSVIRVFDRFAMIMGGRPELVAQMRYHTDYDLLAYDSMRVAHWYNDALLVIESNTMETRDKDRDIEDMSEYILDIIAGLYDNLYARAGNPESVKQGKPRRWGFQTNSSTKPAIIGHLIECVREHLWIERDAYCVEELALYEKNEKGQFSAPPGRGNHDDVVMATAIALWISNREMDTPQWVVPLGNDLLRHADPNNNAAI